MDILKEESGKQSYSRILGAACIITVLAVYITAAINQNWETVRSMSLDISGLGAALYGINKLAGAWQSK